MMCLALRMLQMWRDESINVPFSNAKCYSCMFIALEASTSIARRSLIVKTLFNTVPEHTNTRPD